MPVTKLHVAEVSRACAGAQHAGTQKIEEVSYVASVQCTKV